MKKLIAFAILLGGILGHAQTPVHPSPAKHSQTPVHPPAKRVVHPSPMERLEAALAQTGLSESDQATAKASCAIDKTESLRMYRSCLDMQVTYLQIMARSRQRDAEYQAELNRLYADIQAQQYQRYADSQAQSKALLNAIRAASAGSVGTQMPPDEGLQDAINLGIMPPSTGPASAGTTPVCSETGSCYGDISPRTGLPKTIYVPGYTRSDGTHVGSYYRSH
jgi:hypothetical protein